MTGVLTGMALMIMTGVGLGELFGTEGGASYAGTGSARRTSGSAEEGCWEIWASNDRQGASIIRVMQSESKNGYWVVRDNLTVRSKVLLHPE